MTSDVFSKCLLHCPVILFSCIFFHFSRGYDFSRSTQLTLNQSYPGYSLDVLFGRYIVEKEKKVFETSLKQLTLEGRFYNLKIVLQEKHK